MTNKKETRSIRRVTMITVAVVVGLTGSIVAPASATPVARNRDEWNLYGRVLLEPETSVDYLQFGDEFAPAMELLEELYPGYVTFTTVDKELKDKNAVSLGPDGLPAWHKGDTGDGQPFHVVVVTDEKVPDKNKEYVFLTNSHASEPCGREGDLRFMEDLLRWRESDPEHMLDAGEGLNGELKEATVKEVLEKTKIYYANTAPDGWQSGDRANGGNLNYSNYNYAGVNSNRVAYHDGWVFPDGEILYENGYTTLTQPESAVVKYFLRIRRDELHGRPFAAAADMHGPLPVGAVLLHDQNNSPARLQRVHDFAERIKQKMEEALASYITEPGVQVYETIMGEAGAVRDQAFKIYNTYVGPIDEKAAYLTLKWAEYATVWEHIDYTVTGTWGGWAAGESGLGADSISFEVDCNSFSPWNPAEQQVYVDNIRAIVEANVVHAAHLAKWRPKRQALAGSLGFYEPGLRVTDADGNPAPPTKTPRNPIWGRVEQGHYDVSNTDYFRDLREIVSTPVVEVRPQALQRSLAKLDAFAVADTTLSDTKAVEDFVRSGGTLVLTDAALQMLPDLIGVADDTIEKGFAYVGYSDLDRSHPWTEGLYPRARQMFDPVGLGYPLLMERDQYWPCGTECEESPTRNSSPIWSIARAAWEEAGGVTVGSVDPPDSAKGGAEGTETAKTNIGFVELGEGRIAIFGALLPQPSEDHDHWFGLNGYTVSIPGQTLLLRALAGD